MTTYQYELFADYFQLCLMDEIAGEEGTPSEDFWTDETVARMLAVAPGIVAVGTVRNMDVPVSVAMLESEPQPDLAAWDHVTECALDVPSGRIVIMGCTDAFADAERIPVSPGHLPAARVLRLARRAVEKRTLWR